MPTYQYRCSQCGSLKDKFNTMADHKLGPECCGQTMRQYFGSISIVPDFKPYVDENIRSDGKPQYVKSKQHRKQLMKDHGVDESYGKGWF